MKILKIIGSILVRIIGFPFFVCISFVGIMLLWFRHLVCYIRFGGEWISYPEPKNKIADVYEEVKKLVELTNKPEL